LTKLVELLIASLYNKGGVVEKKKMEYKVAIENRYLIRYFK